METIYFFIFCLIIAYIIFWGFRNDDQSEFQGQKRDKRFTPSKKNAQLSKKE